MITKLRLFCLILAFFLLAACEFAAPADSVESLRKTVVQDLETIDNETLDRKTFALYKLRDLDEAACADAAYVFLTQFACGNIGSLAVQFEPGAEYVQTEDILADLFALCEKYGYADVRETTADLICEQTNPDIRSNVGPRLCGKSPEFFELFLPRMLRAGWYTLEEGNVSTDYAVSRLCNVYFEDAGDELPARLAFVSREIIPLTGTLTEFEPIPWTQPVPEPLDLIESRKAGKCLVLSRASGSQKNDHGWQVEPAVCLLLPKNNLPSSEAGIDTLILLDTTWEEAGKYSSGQLAFAELTQVSLIDAETGAPLCEAQTFREAPGSFVMTDGRGDIYTVRDYEKQTELVDFIKKSLKQ